ncbi:WXG100 family type VII secretion target [Streptomyces mirabilis]|uniref:WXG100 family type VII secretion target n=1 Tax=Streptomyces mirabilis TaxID=68239 RepID=UPI0036C5DA40
MSVQAPALDPAQALATVGLPDPGGDPRALHNQAQADYDLATELRAHSAHLEDLLRQSQQVWQGAAADTFRQGMAAHTADVTAVADFLAQSGGGHEEHASQQKIALEILKELGIQIAVTLAYIAAAALFPPLVAAAEMQLVALAAQAGRIVRWLADLLSAVVRFLVRARAWIAQFTKLTWRTRYGSFGYGKLAFDGARDMAVDVLSNLTARGITGRPMDITMLYSMLGSGAAGGLVGGLEASGFKRVLTESGDIARAADGLPKFVSLGDQAKTWVKSVGRKPAGSGGQAGAAAQETASAAGSASPRASSVLPDSVAGSPQGLSRAASSLDGVTQIGSPPGLSRITSDAAVGSLGRQTPRVPSRDELARVLGGGPDLLPENGIARFAEPPPATQVRPTTGGSGGTRGAGPGSGDLSRTSTVTAEPAGSLDPLLTARAEARKLGLRGLPSEGPALVNEVTQAQSAHQAAELTRSQAQRALGQASDGLAQAQQEVAQQAQRVATVRAGLWAAESGRDIAKVSGDTAQAARTTAELARAQVQHRAAVEAWEAARQSRAAAEQTAGAARVVADEAQSAARSTGQKLENAVSRQDAWEEFARAGQQVRQEASASARFAEAWQRSPWKEGYPTQYTPAVQDGGAQLRPQEWTASRVGGLPRQPLEAIGTPKVWQEAVVYEPVKGFFKGALGNTLSTAMSYRPGQTNDLVWAGVPLAGVGNVARDLAKGWGMNRIFPDKSVEDAVFRVATKSLGKHIHGLVMTEIGAAPVYSQPPLPHGPAGSASPAVPHGS